MSSRKDGPPRMTSIDRLIDRLGRRSSVAISAIPQRLAATKEQRVSREELIREKSDLIQEINYFRNLTENSRAIVYEVGMAMKILQRCLGDFNANIEAANEDWARTYAGVNDHKAAQTPETSRFQERR